MSGASKSGDAVLVIGAGIIGIACAHFLSRAGYRVTVIDKGTVAGGCSSGNNGHILPSHIHPLNSPSAFRAGLASLVSRKSTLRVRPTLKPSELRWFWQFSRRCFGSHGAKASRSLAALLDSSVEMYDEIIGEGLDCDWRCAGLLYIFKSERALEAFWKAESAYDLGPRRVGVNALADKYPSLADGLAGGVMYAQDASLDPARLTRAWSSRLESDGVRFVESCEFEALRTSGARITGVETAQGRFEADHVVLAAGALSSHFAHAFGCAVPVQPGKGYTVTYPRPKGHADTSLVMPEASLAVTSLGKEMRVGSMMEFAGYDDKVHPRRIDRLRESVQPFLRDRLGVEVARWSGLRPMTWDSLPMIGRTATFDNAVIATGHQMIGMMSAPATGRMVADIISGRPTHIDSRPFSPTRFN